MIWLMVSTMIADNSQMKAVNNLPGCDIARFLDERVCLKDGTYYFVDIQCNRMGWDCTAEIVKVDRFVVELQ